MYMTSAQMSQADPIRVFFVFIFVHDEFWFNIPTLSCQIWSHLPLNGNDVIQKSRAPPSRQRFTSEQVHDMAHSDEPPELVESTEEDPTVLALFDTLVDQDESGQLLTTSSDATSSSVDIGDDVSYFLHHDSDEDLLSSSDSENMAFGTVPSSSRSFWLDLPFSFPFSHRHYLGSSSDSLHSTPSELSFANTSSIEPPWSDADMEELDRELRSDGDSEIEARNEFDRQAKRNWKTHEFSCDCDSDDPSCPQVRKNNDNIVSSNNADPTPSSASSCPKKSKNKFASKSSSTFQSTSSNTGKKSAPSKSSSAVGNSSAQKSSTQGQSTSSITGDPKANGSMSSSRGATSFTNKTKAKSKRKRAPRRPRSNASSYDPPWSDADMEELDREMRGDGDSEIEALNEFDRRAKRNWRTHEFSCDCDSDDPSCPQVTIPSSSSALAQSSASSCPQKLKNKSAPKSSLTSQGTSSNTGKKAKKITPSKFSSATGGSSVSGPSVSSTQGQSTSYCIGSEGPQPESSSVASSANGSSSSTRKTRTKSRRQLITSRSQSGPNYEDYNRDDFIKTKPTTSFYSKKK